HLAVGLGAAVGAAVLAGALLVGDSLRGSLRDRADRQLFGTEQALVGGRFFREQLAAELPGNVKPVVLLQRSVTAGDGRVGLVIVLGVDAPFGVRDLAPSGNSAIVAGALSRALDLTPCVPMRVTL